MVTLRSATKRQNVSRGASQDETSPQDTERDLTRARTSLHSRASIHRLPFEVISNVASALYLDVVDEHSYPPSSGFWGLPYDDLQAFRLVCVAWERAMAPLAFRRLYATIGEPPKVKDRFIESLLPEIFLKGPKTRSFANIVGSMRIWSRFSMVTKLDLEVWVPSARHDSYDLATVTKLVREIVPNVRQLDLTIKGDGWSSENLDAIYREINGFSRLLAMTVTTLLVPEEELPLIVERGCVVACDSLGMVGVLEEEEVLHIDCNVMLQVAASRYRFFLTDAVIHSTPLQVVSQSRLTGLHLLHVEISLQDICALMHALGSTLRECSFELDSKLSYTPATRPQCPLLSELKCTLVCATEPSRYETEQAMSLLQAFGRVITHLQIVDLVLLVPKSLTIQAMRVLDGMLNNRSALTSLDQVVLGFHSAEAFKITPEDRERVYFSAEWANIVSLARKRFLYVCVLDVVYDPAFCVSTILIEDHRKSSIPTVEDRATYNARQSENELAEPL